MHPESSCIDMIQSILLMLAIDNAILNSFTPICTVYYYYISTFNSLPKCNNSHEQTALPEF